MIRVFLDSAPTLPSHAVRGMGRYAQELENALKGNKRVQLVSREKADIFHYPYFDLFFLTLPKKNDVPTVVTVHDTHPLIYPDYFPTGIRGRLKFNIQKKRLKDVDAIITNTETTKKDTIRFLDIPADKIFVTHFAPSTKYRKLETENWRLETQKRFGLPKRFVLYVGDVNYNKNIPGLIEAFSLLKKSSVALVLVGKGFTANSSESREVIQLIKQLKVNERVHILGYIPDADLIEIYNLATVYCQPSFYEGFGFPVLEAMACGVPVVAGQTQALAEIAEGAALFVDPKNPRDIARGLEEVLSSRKLQQRLAEAGLKKIKEYSWKKVANETVDIYQKILGR